MARPDDGRGELGSLELISRHVERQLDLQWGHWDIIDGRLRLLLAFVGAVFVAVLAFIANRAGDLAGATVGLVVAAILLLMLSGLIAGLAWLPREFDDNQRRIDEKLAAFRYAAGGLAGAVFLMAIGAIVELLK